MFFKCKFFIILFNNFFYHINICCVEICIKKAHKKTFTKIKFIFFFSKNKNSKTIEDYKKKNLISHFHFYSRSILQLDSSNYFFRILLMKILIFWNLLIWNLFFKRINKKQKNKFFKYFYGFSNFQIFFKL